MIIQLWYFLVLKSTVLGLKNMLLELPKNTSVRFFINQEPDVNNTNPLEDISLIQKRQPLTLISHGFQSDSIAVSAYSIREALLRNGVKNVVVVDWAPLANSEGNLLKAYQQVVQNNVPQVADLVAKWLKIVMKKRKIAPWQVHLIGFSLGAHICGLVGNRLHSKIGRITGLDPPKIGYAHKGIGQRLDKSDAHFVDVIHTTGKSSIFSFQFGYTEAIGHADYFPNGGVSLLHAQPGCTSKDITHKFSCSHDLAYVLYVESVFNKNAFSATKCADWESFEAGKCKSHLKVPMGYSISNKTRGTYYFRTKSSVPYGKEDPANPLPPYIKDLLVYNEEDSIFKPCADKAECDMLYEELDNPEYRAFFMLP